MTAPSLFPQHTRSKGPFLRRHYSASTVVRPSPPSESGHHPIDDVKGATFTTPGSPPITQISLFACRAHYPGGPDRCVSVSSPSVLPSPDNRRVGVHDCTSKEHCVSAFACSAVPCWSWPGTTGKLLSGPARASLALRPANSQPAYSGPCPEAPTRPVAQPSRSVATMPTDNYMGGSSLHWKSAPLGRAVIAYDCAATRRK